MAGGQGPGGGAAAWCGKEKTSFVAVRLDVKNDVEVYFLCPANGSVNTEGQNTANGLESVDMKFQTKDKRMKGTLKTGQGSCSGPTDVPVYCTPDGRLRLRRPGREVRAAGARAKRGVRPAVEPTGEPRAGARSADPRAQLSRRR